MYKQISDASILQNIDTIDLFQNGNEYRMSNGKTCNLLWLNKNNKLIEKGEEEEDEEYEDTHEHMRTRRKKKIKIETESSN
jgi:hypothetical protein